MDEFKAKLLKNLPPEISETNSSEYKAALQRFEKMAIRRPAPLSDTGRTSKYSVFWPGESLSSRLIPGGITTLDKEDGYDYDVRLDRFLKDAGIEKVYFWAIGSEHLGIYTGDFTDEIRWWIKGSLIVSPSVVISVDQDFIMIADEQGDYSVIGASAPIIKKLETAFGGPQTLKANFLDWADNRGVFFGAEGIEWAYRFPIHWCGWD